jgi:hypothetical protein
VPLVGGLLRFVTHRDVTRAQVLAAARIIERVLEAGPRSAAAGV